MSEAEVKKCRDWLDKQQKDMETAAFGLNKTGIAASIEKQKKRHGDIVNYRTDLDKLLDKPALPDEAAKELSVAYDCLLALSAKRRSCLEVIAGIASLEDQIEMLATDFDAKAVHLVNSGDKKCENKGNLNQTNESMARAAQNCIVAVRNNWKWLEQVMKCSQKHLQNAADYHDFFHEVDEAEYWMNTTLSKMHLTFDKSKMNGDRADAADIQDEMKVQNEIDDVLLAYLQWQTKVDSLFDKGKDIVPVRKRLQKQEEPLPVVSLASYRTDQIEFVEDETLTLLDNSNKTKWLVKNTRGQTAEVPAVLLEIPAPFGDAVDAAVRLRIQLLSLWTASVKRLGYKMIAFMLLIFQDWSDEEIKSLQCMSPQDKKELLRIVQLIEDTLIKNWSGYRDFDELEEKMSRLRTILEESPDDAVATKGDPSLSTVVVQIKALEDLLNKYRDFWDYWNTFKVIVELIKQPKYLLVCDKWDQLRFVTNAHFVKFWDTTLDLQEGPQREGYWETNSEGKRVFITKESDGVRSDSYYIKGKKGDSTDGSGNLIKAVNEDTVFSENISRTPGSVTFHEKPREPFDARSSVSEFEEHEETEADEVRTSIQEERSTFFIESCIDPRTKKQISVQEAIMAGILDQATGSYINPTTGDTMPIAEAMNEGFIQVEFTSVRKLREEKKSFGLITIKITRETRPYSMKKVLCPATEEELELDEAVDRGILDIDNGTYKTETGQILPIMDAVHSGLIKVEFEGERVGKPEIIQKTYAVSGVVDQKRKKKVPFSDAVRFGLIDRKTGEYINNETWQKVHVTEAIMRGFIKARIVTDPSKLDIEPENRLVIERLEMVKTKILRAIRTAKAFREAANLK